jgi:hypothetical protein
VVKIATYLAAYTPEQRAQLQSIQDTLEAAWRLGGRRAAFRLAIVLDMPMWARLAALVVMLDHLSCGFHEGLLSFEESVAIGKRQMPELPGRERRP